MINPNNASKQGSQDQQPAQQASANQQSAMNDAQQTANAGQPDNEREIEEGLQNSPEKEMD